jgi:hypothetical protein
VSQSNSQRQAKLRARQKALIAGLREQIALLRTALEPFSKIEPSSLFAPDGRDLEGYEVFLSGSLHPDRAAFTGLDLFNARTIYEGTAP